MLIAQNKCPSCDASLWSHPTPCMQREHELKTLAPPTHRQVRLLPTSVQRRVDIPKMWSAIVVMPNSMHKGE